MRKLKKINGYLVIKFNDRERRENPSLGAYGVIDAEFYTGDLDLDRSEMEYDDAETLEVAVEQARGLDAEKDFSDEPPRYAIVVETDERVTEEDVSPQLMIDGWERRLQSQVKNHHYPDTDPRTAAHELYGFKMALHQLGLIPESDVRTDPDHFGPGRLDGPVPVEPEEFFSYICDQKCKERIPGRTQEELDNICEKCVLERLASDADERERRRREKAGNELNRLVSHLHNATLPTEVARQIEYGARQYLQALQTTGAFTQSEVDAMQAAIDTTAKRHKGHPMCCGFQDDGFKAVHLLAGRELAELSPHDFEEMDVIEGCTIQTLKCRKCGHESFAWFNPRKGAVE